MLKNKPYDFLISFIYPILFAANIVLSLAAVNIVNLSDTEILSFTVIFSVGTAVVWFVLWPAMKNSHRVSFLLLLFILCFFYFGLISDTLRNRMGIELGPGGQIVILTIWIAFFFLLGSNWLWRKITSPQTISSYFALLSVLLTVLSIYRIVEYKNGQIRLGDYEDAFPAFPDLQATWTPDIYYVILDGYGREDVLSEQFAFDNSSFIEFLRQRGFYVAENSYANYMQTALSLSSSMNMDYLPELPVASRDGAPLVEFLLNSRVLSSLKSLGYTTYTFQTPYGPTNLSNADHYYAGLPQLRVNALAGLILMNSIGQVAVNAGWLEIPLPRFEDQQMIIQKNIAELERIVAQEGPKFVFLHMIVPHPPFIFDATGPITPQSVYLLADGQTFVGSQDDYVQGYRQQIQYVNHQVQNLLDQILTKSVRQPVIILQGDHGPGSRFTEEIENTCIQERAAILNAYFLPDISSGILYAGISPVNSFRVILNFYFSTQIELLGDKAYYSNFSNPYHFYDVTNLVDRPCSEP